MQKIESVNTKCEDTYIFPMRFAALNNLGHFKCALDPTVYAQGFVMHCLEIAKFDHCLLSVINGA